LAELFQNKADVGLLAQLYLFDEYLAPKELAKNYQLELGIQCAARGQRLICGQESLT
jgi:hypothetical protein